MKGHLSDAEVIEMLSAESLEPGSHVEHCDECRSSIARLRYALLGLPRWARSVSEKPEEFWSGQRSRIQRAVALISQEQTRRMPRLAWVAATAMIAAATLLLKIAPIPKPPVARSDPDYDLLIEVERVVESGGPEALAPATLLLQQASQQQQPRRVSEIEMEMDDDEN